MKKLLRILILFIFFLLIKTELTNAQTTKKTLFAADIGALSGISSNAINEKDFSATRVRLSVYRLFTEKMGFGIGIGTDSFHEKGSSTYSSHRNTFTIDLTGIYFLKAEQKGFFTDTYLGYSPKISDNFEKGMNFGLGLGYAFKLGSNSKINIKTGYNFQQINDGQYHYSGNNYTNLNISAIRITLGLTF